MGDWNRDDDEYMELPWETGTFHTLAEIEMAYGDNCVDGTMTDVAERWARRSGTTSPCIGLWVPKGFDIDKAIGEWAQHGPKVKSADGTYLPAFSMWLTDKLGNSSEFQDFVWDRYAEFAVETATTLRQNIFAACGDEVIFTPDMFDRFRDRISALPFHVKAQTPPLPDDTEERLYNAVVRIRKARSKNVLCITIGAGNGPSPKKERPRPATKQPQDRDKPVLSKGNKGVAPSSPLPVPDAQGNTGNASGA